MNIIENIKIPFYTLFIIYLPFLFFAVGNIHELNNIQIILVLLLPCIIALIIYSFSFLISLFIKKFNFKSLIIFLSFISFFIFNYSLMNLNDILYFSILIIIPFLLTFVIASNNKIENIVSKTIYLMSIVCFFQIFIAVISENEDPDERTIFDKLAFEFEYKPNIYSITLDGYSRSDELIKIGFDNSNFDQFLIENDFFIANYASSNFTSTFTSMYSLWMMQYIDIKKGNLKINYKVSKNALLGKNNVTKILKKNGYEHIRMGPNQAQLQDCSGIEDLCLYKKNEIDGNASGVGRNIFVQIILMSPIDKVVSLFNPNFLNRKIYLKSTISDAISSWNKIDLSNREPYFFEINVWQPHGPYIYDSDCNEKKIYTPYRNSSINSPVIIAEYIDETKCVNKQIKNLIKNINNKDPESIIIIQSDHGHSFFIDWNKPTNQWSKKAYQSRTSILWAARYPDEKCMNYLYNHISTVNTFRILFACLAKKEPELLEDKIYINGSNLDDPIFLYK